MERLSHDAALGQANMKKEVNQETKRKRNTKEKKNQKRFKQRNTRRREKEQGGSR
jgi:hypothetical protein